jgi:hypothetical protein
MYCRVCGDESNTKYRPSKLQTLCDSCNRDTPRKIGRERFDAVFWKSSDPTEPLPCESVRREFYEDYLRSTKTIGEYIAGCTSVCDR